MMKFQHVKLPLLHLRCFCATFLCPIKYQYQWCEYCYIIIQVFRSATPTCFSYQSHALPHWQKLLHMHVSVLVAPHLHLATLPALLVQPKGQSSGKVFDSIRRHIIKEQREETARGGKEKGAREENTAKARTTPRPYSHEFLLQPPLITKHLTPLQQTCSCQFQNGGESYKTYS